MCRYELCAETTELKSSNGRRYRARFANFLTFVFFRREDEDEPLPPLEAYQPCRLLAFAFFLILLVVNVDFSFALFLALVGQLRVINLIWFSLGRRYSISRNYHYRQSVQLHLPYQNPRTFAYRCRFARVLPLRLRSTARVLVPVVPLLFFLFRIVL